MSSNYEVPIGYWKIPFGEVQSTIKCPYKYLSCIGGSIDLTLSNISTGMYSSIYCHNTFKGVLCSQAIDYNYIDWTVRDSLTCSDSTTIISMFLITPLLFFVPLTICFYSGKKTNVKNSLQNRNLSEDKFSHIDAMSKERIKRKSPSQETNSDSSTLCSHPTMGFIYQNNIKSNSSISSFEDNPVRKIRKPSFKINNSVELSYKTTNAKSMNKKVLIELTVLKLLIFSLQLSSSLPNYLSCNLPLVTSKLLQITGLLSLASPMIFPWKCISNMSYQQIMEIVTFSIFVIVLIGILMFFIEDTLANYRLAKRTEYRNFRDRTLFRYCTVFFIGVYILIGGITEIALGSIFCVNVDPDGFYPPDSANVLWNDTILSCNTSEYNFGLLWAIGVLMIFSLGSQMISVAMLSCYSNHHLSNTRRRKQKITNREKDITMISILHNSYKPDGLGLYWDIIQNIYKIFMMGVLPQLRNTESWVKIIIAFGVTLLFSQLSRYVRAHLDKQNQFLESIALYQTMLLQLGAFFLAFQGLIIILIIDYYNLIIIDSNFVTILIDILQTAVVVSIPLYYIYIRFKNEIVIDKIKTFIWQTSDKIVKNGVIDTSKRILASTSSFRSSNGSDKYSVEDKNYIGNRRIMRTENSLLFKVDSNYYLNEEVVSIYSGNQKFTQSIYSINSTEYPDDKDTEGMEYNTADMCITKTLTKVCTFMEDSSSCSLDSSDLQSLNLYFPYDTESTKNPKEKFHSTLHEDLEEFTTMSHNEWLQMPSNSDKSTTSTI